METLSCCNGPDYKRPEGQSLQDAIAQTRAAIPSAIAR